MLLCNHTEDNKKLKLNSRNTVISFACRCSARRRIVINWVSAFFKSRAIWKCEHGSNTAHRRHFSTFQMSPHHIFSVSHKTWCTRVALALPTSCTAWTITKRRYMTLFDWSSQRTERCAGTIPCPRERGSSRTPPCKQGCPEVYPQLSKKISLLTFWSHLVYHTVQVL